MAAGDEPQDAPPEVRAVLDHHPGGPLLCVEDLPGVAEERAQAAGADDAEAQAGLRVEEIVLHVHRGETAVLDDQDRLRLRLVRVERQFGAQADRFVVALGEFLALFRQSRLQLQQPPAEFLCFGRLRQYLLFQFGVAL